MGHSRSLKREKHSSKHSHRRKHRSHKRRKSEKEDSSSKGKIIESGVTVGAQRRNISPGGQSKVLSSVARSADDGTLRTVKVDAGSSVTEDERRNSHLANDLQATSPLQKDKVVVQGPAPPPDAPEKIVGPGLPPSSLPAKSSADLKASLAARLDKVLSERGKARDRASRLPTGAAGAVVVAGEGESSSNSEVKHDGDKAEEDATPLPAGTAGPQRPSSAQLQEASELADEQKRAVGPSVTPTLAEERVRQQRLSIYRSEQDRKRAEELSLLMGGTATNEKGEIISRHEEWMTELPTDKAAALFGMTKTSFRARNAAPKDSGWTTVKGKKVAQKSASRGGAFAGIKAYVPPMQRPGAEQEQQQAAAAAARQQEQRYERPMSLLEQHRENIRKGIVPERKKKRGGSSGGDRDGSRDEHGDGAGGRAGTYRPFDYEKTMSGSGGDRDTANRILSAMTSQKKGLGSMFAGGHSLH